MIRTKLLIAALAVCLCGVLALVASSAFPVQFGHPAEGAPADPQIQDATPGAYESVPVGKQWNDTAGHAIQAHGGGFLEKDGWYYWVGEDKSHRGADLYGVNLYKSQDLMNWTFVKRIVSRDMPGICVSGNYTGPGCKIERPKLIFNPTTETFVVWGHWETRDSYEAGHLVVLTSETVDGDYVLQRNFRPGAGEVAWDSRVQWTLDPTYQGNDGKPGYPSRDFTLFADSLAGDAYLVSSQDHATMRLYKLTADWTDVEWESSYEIFQDQRREAPAMTKAGQNYYVVTSGQSGWMPNQAMVSSSNNPTDPNSWSELQPLGNNSTFYSQPTFIMPIGSDPGDATFVYMGDRWNEADLSRSSYVWLPLTLNKGEPAGATMHYTPSWSPTAKGSDELVCSLISNDRSVVAPAPEDASRPPTAANDGERHNVNKSGDNSNYYDPPNEPFSWMVDLGNAYRLGRLDIAFRAINGSEVVHAYTVEASLDGQVWTQVVDRTSNNDVGFTSDQLTGSFRYVRLNVASATNFRDGSDGLWASGLVEVGVYAASGCRH